MKALFCYDGPIQYDDKGNFYSPVINNTVFKRYLNHAECLDVAIRTEHCGKKFDVTKTQKIDTTKVDIVSIPNLSTAKGFIFDKYKARKILAERFEKVDFLIIRLPSFIGAQAVKVANKMKKPYLIEVVGCPWDSLWNYGLKGKIMAPYLKNSMKHQVKNATNVIYVTSEFLQNRYPTLGESTNCSNVEIDNVPEDILIKRIDHIKKNNNKLILGTAAAVNVPYKGHQYVIEAIAELKKRGINNYIYQMVGNGDRSRLEELIKKLGVENEVEFMGTKTHQQVFDWLDTIDIYIQPSRQEGLPRALIEAMSRGLPCIGAHTGGIPELLKKDRIFSNTKNNINEICHLLENFNKDNMQDDAKRNFLEAKKYIIDIISEKRNNMLDMVVKKVQ